MKVRFENAKIPPLYEKACRKWCEDYLREYWTEYGQKLLHDSRKRIITLVLHQVMVQFGKKKPSLEKFYHAFEGLYRDVGERYDYGTDDDVIFAMDCELQRIGVNVEELLSAEEEEERKNESI